MIFTFDFSSYFVVQINNILYYILYQALYQISTIILSNIYIKRTPDFQKIVQKINKNLKEISDQEQKLIPDKNRIQSLKQENQKLSAKLASRTLKIKLVTMFCSFFWNRFVNQKFQVQVELPFQIPVFLRRILQRGVKNPTPYELSPRMFNMLYAQSVRSLLARFLSVKVPRVSAASNSVMRALGVSQEDMKAFEGVQQMFNGFM